jgi:gliding motility-associated-like protein
LVGPDNVGDVAGDDVSPAIFNNVGAGTYGIIVLDSKGCASPRSLTFVAPVPALDPGLVGFDQSICFDQENADELIELAAATGGTGSYTYEWQQSATGDVANDAEWFTIPGATSPTFDPDATSPFAAPGTIHYRRLVRTTSTLPTPPAFCQNPTGKNRKVTVNVHPKPIVTFEPVSSEICEGLPLVIDVAVQPGTGTLPLNYDYTDGNVNFSGEIASKIIVPNIQNSATYTLTRAEDANGCLSEDVPIVRNISVIKLNSDFQVVQPGEGCSGSEFSFTWDADPTVEYRWVWGDGTSEVTYNGAADPQISGPQTERHVFVSGSTNSDTFYPVRLIAIKGLCPPKPTSKEVKVYPRIILNILPGDTELCSGETLTIRDQSLGVTSGKWYYQENTPGNTDRLEEKNGPVSPLTYVLTNNTTANPLSLRVVYEAENGNGCTDTEDVIVQVYRGVNADFNVDAVPDFVGGVSEVQLTNTSVPNDGDFSYTFDYGDDEAIETFNDGTSYRVLYNSPGARDIQLRVVNLAAQAAGESCVSTVVKQINVNQPDLNASFTVTPRAFCLPGTIVADNQSPGADTFEWTLSRDGVVIDVTTVTDPSWTISAPGSYTVQLVASYSQSTQAPVVQTVSGIQVFDNPVAQFEIFLSQAVYIGTPVRVDNGTTGATRLSWNFGDHPESENSDLPNPTHVYQTEGNFDITLTAYNDHGPFDQDGDGVSDGNVVCSDQAVQQIFVKPGGTLKVPNAFTPHEGNSEGGGPGAGTTNDYFLPIMDGVEEFTMQIFDRWGTLLFESRDKNQGWSGHDRNGRLMPAGVYVYKIVLRLTDNSRTTKIGDVTLIR